MNKKLFLGMFAVTGMLLATSCQNDELNAVQSGNEATVSFTLGVEGGVQTRAISEGTGANKLVYAVFDEAGVLIKGIGMVTETQLTDLLSGHDVTITLAKGQTYKVAFWAQNEACTAYNTNDLKAVTVNYGDENTTYNNNDETRDAFFATVKFTVDGDKTIPVTLKRPFAQINVGVTTDDWNKAVASGIEIEKSKVVIKNAATSINLLDGSVSGKANVSYDFAKIPKLFSPAETLKVDLDGDGTPTEYNYLSMSYILVNDGNGGAENANLDEVEFTFKPKNSEKNDIVFNTGLNNVPVQRNYRTNIIGQLLTGNFTFNITINHYYDGEIDKEDNDLTVRNVRAGDNFYKTLADAISAGETDIVLDEGEHALTGVKSNVKISGVSTAAKINIETPGCNDVDVTFENVTLAVPNTGYKGVQHVGNMTANNCVIEGQLFLYGPSTFKNCTFNNSGDYYNVWTYGATKTTFTGCTFNCDGKAVLIYTEGKINAEHTFDNCTFNDSGNDVYGSDGNIKEIKKAAIEIGSSPYSTETTYKVVANNCKVNGFAVTDEGISTNSTLWGNKNSMDKDHLEIVIDGTEVY